MTDQTSDATTPPAPPDPELVRLEALKKRAEAQKAIAEANEAIVKANKNALVAQRPELKVEVPTETFSVGEKPYVPRLVAHGELKRAGKSVAQFVANALGDDNVRDAKVLIVQSFDLTRDHGIYKTMTSMLANFRSLLDDALESLAPPPHAPASRRMSAVETTEGRLDEADAKHIGAQGGELGLMASPLLAAGAVVDTALSGLSAALTLMRSNVTIRDSEFTLRPATVVAAVAGPLEGLGVDVSVAGFTPLTSDEVFGLFRELEERRHRLVKAQLVLQRGTIATLTGEVASLRERLQGLHQKRDSFVMSDPPTDTGTVDGAIEDLAAELAEKEFSLAESSAYVEASSKLITALDAFIATAHASADAQGLPPVVTAAVLEGFLAESEKRYVMLVDAEGGGQSQYEEKVGKDKVLHIGGVSLSFLMVDAQGTVVASGVETRLGSTSHVIGNPKFEKHGEKVGD